MSAQSMTYLERSMLTQLKQLKLIDGMVQEHRFDPKRGWRFDFAWPDRGIAVEVEGGTWVEGRHTRGKAFEEDCAKYNGATLLGWSVYRFTTDMVTDGRAVLFMREVLS